MSDKDRRKRGEEMLKEVYAGDVNVPPEGMPFADLMLKQLFAFLVQPYRKRAQLLPPGHLMNAHLLWSRRSAHAGARRQYSQPTFTSTK